MGTKQIIIGIFLGLGWLSFLSLVLVAVIKNSKKEGKKNMKIRQGFVSNSSSSSFVIMARQIDYNAAMDKLEPAERQIIEVCLIDKRAKFMGEDIIMLGYLNIMDSGPFNSQEGYQVFYKFCRLLEGSIQFTIEG